MPSRNVTLTSTLNKQMIAYPGQSITFTCVTSDSDILQWSSSQYIGTGDIRLELYPDGDVDLEPSNANQHTFARRLSNTSNNEPPVIVSELHLIASLQHPVTTITCAKNGHGQNESITFRTNSKCISGDGNV